MSILTQKEEELHDTQTARAVTGALRDISAFKLQGIRKEFERGKNYYKEVENLYRLIKRYAIRRGLILSPETEMAEQTLSVAITSNKRLYGSLNRDVMEALLVHMKEEPRNAFLVVGQTGRQYVENTPYEKRVTYFEFTEDEPAANDVVRFIDLTRRYKNVLMFYPQFANVFKQTVALADITYVSEKKEEKMEERIDYIFEPELREIFWFFETQVRYVLFHQVMLEVLLARTSARLVRMNMAEQNAVELIGDLKIMLNKYRSSISNMRLLETFSGITKWKKNL